MRPLYLGGNLDFPFVNVCLEPNVNDAERCTNVSNANKTVLQI